MLQSHVKIPYTWSSSHLSLPVSIQPTPTVSTTLIFRTTESAIDLICSSKKIKSQVAVTMVSAIVMIFLYFLLLGHAAADSGDDFSNNLFTDISPYDFVLPNAQQKLFIDRDIFANRIRSHRLLALFGERVTMQFISQAMGLSDCIILAMAPLGIITIIVAAIRVGGPSWLKALIGRATENLAAAELELMSSTSNEVCELWNGNDVVRCAGSAPVWEFICLLPTKGELPQDPKVEIMDLNKAKGLYMKECK